ncbi:hypothetical protein MNEG_9932 [Monoraphidium neglectum]|uniref:Uncharacterized protein n=1 Tax=Monoraphidium neglectum TaxID=145388 RepID=A0A0D2KR18_9CHLO|nr:hypothetical protein MNEG_9932 [Monoraphidium neglectum]KIY98028.1 hypothetical protein MNEG_9932 [Monoraphidium neglectum]|eukprot:XP_013897048.1 hypothetical protein MNEG_9932 [Monoraphidium neglectum]
MSLDPDLALDEYLGSGNIQSYFKGTAFATIRALGAWEPGMERTIGGFNAVWRDFKERWGTVDITEAKRALETPEKLLSAAAVDPTIAAQLVWTVASLADGCPQLSAALARAGVDAAAAPELARLKDGSAGPDEEQWCADLLATARGRPRA